MKKLIVLSLIVAGIVLMAGFSTPAQVQSPGVDAKPTFISPTPGLYVNGWPPFTVSYPKDWEELPPKPMAVFEAAGTRLGLYPSPVLAIMVLATPLPIEDWAKIFIPAWSTIFTDIKVLSDKPSQLKDGAPAREIEWEFVRNYDALQMSLKNAPKHNGLLFVTKKDSGACVAIRLTDYRGKLGEELKSIAYSLTFLQGREEPVKVPPDVQAFLDMYCVDVVNHDVKAIMEHYSDRFRHSSGSKASMELWFRNDPNSPIHTGVSSLKAIVTVFEPQGDKAYVDGFYLAKAKGDAAAMKTPMYFQQIINEHGHWKWFGNQK